MPDPSMIWYLTDCQVLESEGAYKVSCGKCGNPLGHEFLKDGPDGVGSRSIFQQQQNVKFSNHFHFLPCIYALTFQILNIQPRFEVCAEGPKGEAVKAENTCIYCIILHQNEA